jgi:hypothetical protein
MNEKYEVIGFERVDYTSKKTGKPVLGYRLYMSFDRQTISGVGCQSEFVSDSDLGSYTPTIGDLIRLFYNRWGRVVGVDVVA